MSPTSSSDLVADTRAKVEAARVAAEAWSAQPVAQRARVLQGVGKRLLAGAEDLALIVHEETGKPLPEAYASDVVGIGDLFTYWCAHGPTFLAPRKARIPALDMPGKSGWIEREARGVIAIISPWNYPAALPMRVIVPALLAGNGVVLKPSEFTTRTGRWLVEALRAELGPLVACVEGAGEAGVALIDAQPDLVHFTGSTRTGRKVAVQCAGLGIPCETELGGKDAAVVLDDVAVARAVAGIAWGVVHNAGQDCASVERVVVHNAVADRFLPQLAAAMDKVKGQVPHLVTPAQRAIVIEQLEEAKALGGTFLCGGLPEGNGPIPPTLVKGLPRTAKLWAEESFGPVAAVEIHSSDDALVEAANASIYGLGGSVWGGDIRRAEAVARRLRTGMVWVNNHAFTGAVPDLPWVGRGASGTGITSSPEALEHLTRPRVVVLDKAKAAEPWWYPYTDAMTGLMRAVVGRHRVGGLGATITTLRALFARNKELK